MKAVETCCGWGLVNLKKAVKMRKQIHVDSNLCTGCGICTMACSVKKSGRFNPLLSGIRIDSDDERGTCTPELCRQCFKPACVRACPAERVWAKSEPFQPPISQDERTGAIVLDSTRESCIGCMECMEACPFGAIRFAPEDDLLVKCDTCGGDPECVKFCPTGAIRFSEITRPRGKRRPIPTQGT